MSGVFQNINSPPPSLPGECVPPTPLVQGEDTLAGRRWGGGSIVWKTSDTALNSIYASTLWMSALKGKYDLPCRRYRRRESKSLTNKTIDLLSDW
jgi:hypothetical protein